MSKEGRTFESWKEIASYLGRSEKTCRQWEKLYGMPVHRLVGASKARVFAYPEELDEWKERAAKRPESERPLDSDHPRGRWIAPAAVTIVVLAAVGLGVWRPWESAGSDPLKAATSSAAGSLAAAKPDSKDSRSGPAYESYLKGRYHLEQGARKGFRTAIVFFRAALAVDPLLAEAYAGLGSAYYLLMSNFYLAPGEAAPLARAAALEALELNEGIAEAHVVLASVLAHYDWDFDGAEKEFRRAIELAPDFAHARHMFAFYLLQRGRADDAIKEMETASSLDPLSQRISANSGCMLLLAGRIDQASERLGLILRQNPENGIALVYYGEVLAAQMRYAEAIEAGRRAIELLDGDHWAELLVAYYHAMGGERAEAEGIVARLDELSRGTYVSPCLSAAICEALGDKEEAFALIEKGVRERDFDINWLMCAPEYERLRQYPRIVGMIPWLTPEMLSQHLGRLGGKERR